MSTKLAILCERLIEAGWLVALIVTPLFFNVYSNRSFDLAKVAALRSIALVMVLAWVVKGLDSWLVGSGVPGGHREAALGKSLARPHPWRLPAANPVLCMALLFLAVNAFATVTSIAPRLSLWGSYERFQGLYTTSAYIVVFLSIVALLRTREQLDRLVTTALVVSLPVSLYGIIQHFGTDPISWSGGNVLARVASTMGNPIFVAAFLSMTVPLTLYRLLESERVLAENEGIGTKAVLAIGSLLNLILHIAAWWIGPKTGSLAAITTVAIWVFEALLLGKPLLPFVRVGSYSVLLSTQLACIYLSQSRGPGLGLVTGIFFFGLLWTLARGKWRWASLVAGLGVAVVLALALINLPDSPVSFVRDVPYMGRLGHAFDASGRVRILIWQGAWQLITADPLRTVIGYGPETMRLSYPPYSPAELRRLEGRIILPSRSHNETLDLLLTVGFIGLSIYLLLFTGLVYLGLKSLGVIRSPLHRNVFLGLCSMGGMGTVVLSQLVDHSWRFFGLALPLGMLGGIFAYVSGYGLRGFLIGKKQEAGDTDSHFLIVATLLSALVAHFVEIQFGIAIETTRTYFWTYAALLVVAGRLHRGHAGMSVTAQAALKPGSTREPATSSRGRRRRQPPSPTGFDVTRSVRSRRLIAASLIVSFVMMTMVYGFLSYPVSRVSLPSMLWLFVFTWVLAGFIIVAETGFAGVSTPNPLRGLEGCGLYAALTLLPTLLFAAVHKGILLQVSDVANIPLPYYALILLILVATGGALLLGERLPARALTGMVGFAAPGLALVVLMIVLATNIDVMRADIYYKEAWVSFHRYKQRDRAIVLSRRAIELYPGQDFYYLFLGRILLEKAQSSGHPQEREALFREAEKSLMQARELNPLNTDQMANLAHLYRAWAQHIGDPTQKTARLQNALAFFEKATALSPSNVRLWNEWGLTYLSMGEKEEAGKKFQHSLTLDDTFAPTYLYLGDLYSVQGEWEKAARAYEQAIAHDQNSVKGHRALAVVYTRMGRVADAVRQYQRVLDLASEDLTSHRNLAQLYYALGHIRRALVHARRALKVAPSTDRPAIEQFIAQLRQAQR